MSDPSRVHRIEPAWRRIIAWCEQYAPETAKAVRPAAGEQAIAAAERATRIAWPLELKKWYSLQDGADHGPNGRILACHTPSSLEYLVSTHRMLVEIWADSALELSGSALEELMAQPAGTRAGVYLPSYLPIGNDGCGVTLVLDARGGALAAPITEFDRTEAETYEGPKWPSLADLLEDIAQALETRGEAANGWLCQVVLSWQVE